MRIKNPRPTLFRLFFLLLAPITAGKAQANALYASTTAASIELYGTFHAMGVIVTIAAVIELCLPLSAYWCILNQA